MICELRHRQLGPKAITLQFPYIVDDNHKSKAHEGRRLAYVDLDQFRSVIELLKEGRTAMRTGSSSVVVIAAFAAFLGLPTAKASVIYQSVPDLTADVTGASSTCSSCGGSSNSAYQIYDSFTLASAAAVDQIEFDAYSPSWNPIFFPTDVSVEIFEYAGPGVVGSLLFSQTFSPSDFVYTFAFATNDIPATLVAVDPIGLALASGEYYISFYNPMDYSSIQFPGTGLGPVYVFGVTNFTLYNEATGFALLGTKSSVPEPSIWAMLLLGFAGVVFAARSGAGRGLSFAARREGRSRLPSAVT